MKRSDTITPELGSFKPKFSYRYLENGGVITIATMLDKEEKALFVAAAFASPREPRFDKKKGRLIATERLAYQYLSYFGETTERRHSPTAVILLQPKEMTAKRLKELTENALNKDIPCPDWVK